VPAPDYSKREEEILGLIAHGLTDKQAALHLGVSVRTVRTHLERLCRKHQIHGRAAAVALWLRDLHSRGLT
jgi:DNA-binding CsgD family transcriptional regulator